MTIQDEVWSKLYRNPVKTEVKIAVMKLKELLPSQIVIGGQRVLISYEGQPVTCYGCGGQVHMQQACPKRLREVTMTDESPPTSWVRVLSQKIYDCANAELGGDVMTMRRCCCSHRHNNLGIWILETHLNIPNPGQYRTIKRINMRRRQAPRHVRMTCQPTYR